MTDGPHRSRPIRPPPPDEPMPMTTARDRPPEEAAEDTSFARGLRVLLTIADRGEIRADDLGTALDMSMSTVYRYLRTLTEFGFIERHEGGYRLGPRLLIGTGANVSSEELIRVADPFLRLLAEETGETAVISRRIGLSAVCLHEIPSAQRPARDAGGRPQRPARPGGAGPGAARLRAGRDLRRGRRRRHRPAARAGRHPAAARRPPRDRRRRHRAKRRRVRFSGSVAIAVPIIRDDGIVGGDRGHRPRDPLRARVARAGRSRRSPRPPARSSRRSRSRNRPDRGMRLSYAGIGTSRHLTKSRGAPMLRPRWTSCADLAPVSDAYASLPVGEAFDWSVAGGDLGTGEWYMVAFRSIRRPGADEARLSTVRRVRPSRRPRTAPGFVHYFKGPMGPDGSCLSFCLWTGPRRRAERGRPAGARRGRRAAPRDVRVVHARVPPRPARP